ncbi:MAG: hypothetical protein RR454_06285 [Clostridia bacterium]
MEYIKLTFAYIKKRFSLLALLVIVPALLLSISNYPTDIFSFLWNFESMADKGFWAILGSVSQMHFSFKILLYALCYLVFLASISAVFGIVDRDLRFGEFTTRHIIAKINENILIAFRLFILFFLILEINAIIIAAFATLWLKVFSPAVALIFTMVIILMLAVVVSCLVPALVLWVPIMCTTGLSTFKSLAKAMIEGRNNFGKVLFACIMPIIPCIIVFFAEIFIPLWVAMLINLVVFAFMIIYFTVLAFVSYYSIEGIEREDEKRQSIWGRGE